MVRFVAALLLLFVLLHSSSAARELKQVQQSGCSISEMNTAITSKANSASWKAGVAQACARRKFKSNSQHTTAAEHIQYSSALSLTDRRMLVDNKKSDTIHADETDTAIVLSHLSVPYLL